MDRDEALRLLRGRQEGISEWNGRRAQGEQVPPLGECDLSGLDLTRANLTELDLHAALFNSADLQESRLSGAQLTEAQFVEARLRRASIRGANLIGANLYGCDLREAVLDHSELRGTHLRRADFFKSSLVGVNMCRARLEEVDFSLADLRGADLAKAVCNATVFACGLHSVRGLNSIVHHGPSELSLQACLSFDEELPEIFMRGCGVPDEDIDYFRGRAGAPVKFYSCFISYTHEDEAFASRLHADLQDNAVRCWFAPQDLRAGDPVLPRVNEAIRLHDKLVIVLSKASIAKQWPGHEVKKALEKEEKRGGQVLCPIRLDEAIFRCTLGWALEISDITRPTGRRIADFTNWKNHDEYQSALQRLLRDLRTGY